MIVLALNDRSTVNSSVKEEHIVGTRDMTTAAIKAEVAKAGLKNVSLPSCSVAGKLIDTGDEARYFALYMRIHALEATGGLTYAQLPRYASPNGKGTNDPARALKGPTGQPLDNPTRSIWVTETALATALNQAFMASRLSLFSLVVGIALLLAGIGFIVLAAGGALRAVAEARLTTSGRAPVAARG